MTPLFRPLAAIGLVAAVAWHSAPHPASAQQTPQAAPPAPPAAPANVPLPAKIDAPRSQLQAEFALAAGDTVLFAYQAKDLNRRSQKILETQAAWLKERPHLKVTLEAYCDDDLPATAMRALCTDRAAEVSAFLVKQGVPAERIATQVFPDPPARKGGGLAAGGRAEEDKNRRGNRRVMTRIAG